MAGNPQQCKPITAVPRDLYIHCMYWDLKSHCALFCKILHSSLLMAICFCFRVTSVLSDMKKLHLEMRLRVNCGNKAGVHGKSASSGMQ